jgi:hypothetical protein
LHCLYSYDVFARVIFISYTTLHYTQKLKKPCSAWIIYSTENRGKIKALHPHYSFKEMAGALSEGFKTLTEEEREVYTAKAKEQKERYVSMGVYV